MISSFARKIEAWYAQNGRILPWRETKDAYRIWVSEIILQQTRIEQGRDYYERFITRFPTVQSLASASEDEVLRLWQGLGYYSRARHMHEASRQMAAQGGFPTNYADILQLPGVGAYTAAAIASFAYGEARAVLDGNVFRVLSRYFDEATPIDSTPGKKLFAALADEMLDRKRPALYNQAIMDFGALLCRQQHPLCDECPLASSCAALAAHTQDERPVKAHRTRVRDRYLTFICAEHEGHVLLQRRGAGDIWQGLYQFPLIESDHALTLEEVTKSAPHGTLSIMAKGCTHQLSHQLLHADVYHLKVKERVCPWQGEWVAWNKMDDYAMPRLLTRIMEQNTRNADGTTMES